MSDVPELANSIYRDYVIDGVPSSGAHEPPKADIRELMQVVGDEIDAVAASAQGGAIYRATLTDLYANPGTFDGQIADVGENSNRYYWNDAEGEWVLIGPNPDARLSEVEEELAVLDGRIDALEDMFDFPVVIGATGPRIAEMIISPVGSRTQFISRHSMVIGRKLEWIQIGFKNSYFSGNGTRVVPPTSLSIVGAKIKGTRWSGLIPWLDTVETPTPTIGAGSELLTARLYPADLGLPSFEAGQTIWWDMSGQLPSGSGRYPLGPVYTYNGGVGAAGFFAIYSPSDHIDQLGTTGNMVAPANALLGNEFESNSGAYPIDDLPPNNMCVGVSYLVGGKF